MVDIADSQKLSFKTHLRNLLASKLIVKEIVDFLSIRDIAKSEIIAKLFKERLSSTQLNIYNNVVIKASEFQDFNKFLTFIDWYQNRIESVYPQTFFLCINSYYLKEDIQELQRPLFLSYLEKLFARLISNSKNLISLRINMARQHGDRINDPLCDLLVPLLKQLVSGIIDEQGQIVQNMQELWIESMATVEMIKQISQFESLKLLKIINCTYVTGEFLRNLRSNNLRTLDFRSSYQIEFNQILECVQNNSGTINNLYVDGEYVKAQQFVELIQNLKNIQELGIFFGQKLKDSFLFELNQKVTGESLRIFKMRKAYKVNNQILNLFFTRCFPNLRKLKLDECRNIQDSTVVLIGTNCQKLRSLSLNWCQQLKSDGIEKVLLNCKLLKKLNLVGLKLLQDQAFERAIQIEEEKKNDIHELRTALDSLKLMNLASCDYVSDTLLYKIKRNHRSMVIFNYYQDEVEL
ncbi:f-box lrr-repeat protein 2 [Stylonychia lemnae]|uniref:F-box lrr-repeat protein 2 n=1 Tax=Stylonychia lemnae TaxID=5949 RepID=A0A077ZXR7_STYLE|nr:f-box lrr-repeat protein 2 [Stylonychia lemnae]|eukprot:CDW74711.1 f-box lrr-repeat protein 2 [Stylonychia lemnae]